MSGIRQIGRNVQNNHSGNVVYKVPNINYNTAVRSSKRVSRGYDKMGGSGLEAVILAYDNLLLSAIPDGSLNPIVDIDNPEFNWETLFYNN